MLLRAFVAVALVLANAGFAQAATVTIHVERNRDGSPVAGAMVQQRAGGYYSHYKATDHHGDVTFDIGKWTDEHCYATRVLQLGAGQVCVKYPKGTIVLRIGGR